MITPDKMVILFDQMIIACDKTREDVIGIEPNDANQPSEFTIWFKDGTNAVLELKTTH